MSDILYYSNYCKYCQSILHFLTKNNLTDKLNFICIDKRVKSTQDNEIYVVLENGNKILLPPNAQSVPTLLLAKENYNVILGENIINHFQSKVREQNNIATSFRSEEHTSELQSH